MTILEMLPGTTWALRDEESEWTLSAVVTHDDCGLWVPGAWLERVGDALSPRYISLDELFTEWRQVVVISCHVVTCQVIGIHDHGAVDSGSSA
jgi:hypothetical protein